MTMNKSISSEIFEMDLSLLDKIEFFLTNYNEIYSLKAKVNLKKLKCL